MSESTRIRKSRLVPTEPHAGRYAVFDFLPQGRRRCRLCGARMRVGNIWKHVERVHGENWTNMGGNRERIAFLLRARRSRRNRREGQYQHATKGEPWRR